MVKKAKTFICLSFLTACAQAMKLPDNLNQHIIAVPGEHNNFLLNAILMACEIYTKEQIRSLDIRQLVRAKILDYLEKNYEDRAFLVEDIYARAANSDKIKVLLNSSPMKQSNQDLRQDFDFIKSYLESEFVKGRCEDFSTIGKLVVKAYGIKKNLMIFSKDSDDAQYDEVPFDQNQPETIVLVHSGNHYDYVNQKITREDFEKHQANIQERRDLILKESEELEKENQKKREKEEKAIVEISQKFKIEKNLAELVYHARLNTESFLKKEILFTLKDTLIKKINPIEIHQFKTIEGDLQILNWVLLDIDRFDRETLWAFTAENERPFYENFKKFNYSAKKDKEKLEFLKNKKSDILAFIPQYLDVALQSTLENDGLVSAFKFMTRSLEEQNDKTSLKNKNEEKKDSSCKKNDNVVEKIQNFKNEYPVDPWNINFQLKNEDGDFFKDKEAVCDENERLDIDILNPEVTKTYSKNDISQKDFNELTGDLVFKVLSKTSENSNALNARLIFLQSSDDDAIVKSLINHALLLKQEKPKDFKEIEKKLGQVLDPSVLEHSTSFLNAYADDLQQDSDKEIFYSIFKEDLIIFCGNYVEQMMLFGKSEDEIMGILSLKKYPKPQDQV